MGRRPGDTSTRDAIGEAALALFAENGYDGTSVRAVAARAGVDPALVRHYFGDKDALFAHAVAGRSRLTEELSAAVAHDGGPDVRAITRTYLTLWEDPETGPVLRALTRSATTSEQAGTMLRELLSSRLRDVVLGDEARARAVSLAAASMLGVAFARHVLRISPIADLTIDELVDTVAPAIQGYLAPPH